MMLHRSIRHMSVYLALPTINYELYLQATVSLGNKIAKRIHVTRIQASKPSKIMSNGR